MIRYRGIFGTHIAAVMRRFLRLCFIYASNPQIVCCSASIFNPKEHFQWLIPQFDASSSLFRQLTVFEQDKDGSPSGEKVFVIWNPKKHKSSGDHSTRSAIYQSAQLLSSLVLSNVVTIAFCQVPSTLINFPYFVHSYIMCTLLSLLT